MGLSFSHGGLTNQEKPHRIPADPFIMGLCLLCAKEEDAKDLLWEQGQKGLMNKAGGMEV